MLGVRYDPFSPVIASLLTGCSTENPAATVFSLCKNGTPPAAAIFGEIQQRCNKRQILLHFQRAAQTIFVCPLQNKCGHRVIPPLSEEEAILCMFST